MLDAITSSHSSTVVSMIGLQICTAALLTSAVMSPTFLPMLSYICSRTCGSEMSASRKWCMPHRILSGLRRSTPTTSQPLFANTSAVALPMPPATPVMTTVRII